MGFKGRILKRTLFGEVMFVYFITCNGSLSRDNFKRRDFIP